LDGGWGSHLSIASLKKDQARSGDLDAVAAVVIDPRDDFQLGIVVEHDTAHDVHLP